MKAFLRRIVALIKKEFITLWYDPKSRAIIVMLSIIDMNQPILNDLPETLRDFINQNQYDNIQYFTAYFTPVQSQCNYFTHTWSMDKMIANRITKVSTGMFEARNLEPLDNQVGINGLVSQTMSFHNNVYMSGNVARFKIADPTKLAEAWFISVYNPNNNDGNVAANNHQQVIVVHWYFFKTDMAIDAQQYPTLVDAINLWNFADVKIIAPQMTPVM